MKNIIIVQDQLIILPYISDIGEIVYTGRLEFHIHSMVSITKVVGGVPLNVGAKWSPVMENLKLNKSKSFDVIEEYIPEKFELIKSEYLKLVEIREKLIIEWDKILDNIEKI